MCSNYFAYITLSLTLCKIAQNYLFHSLYSFPIFQSLIHCNHSLIHFMFDMLGMRPRSEVASSRGRSDLVLENAESVMVFEFKYNKSAQAALDQILERKYYEKYMYKGKAITLVGIDFNFKNKTLELEWLKKSI